MHSFALTLLCVLTIYPAVAKDTGLIFVSNEKTNNIIVIDPNAYKVINNIKVGRRPRNLHFNADHTLGRADPSTCAPPHLVTTTAIQYIVPRYP